MKKKLKLKKKFLVFICFLLFTFLFLFSLYKIIVWKYENNKNNNIVESIKTDIIRNDGDDVIINEKALKDVNENAVGYIIVNNTKIDYPFVQAKDNKYYLNHNIKNEYNSAGWVFADYRNKLDGTDKNIILYAHARLDGSMFGSIEKMFKPNWYNNKENLKIKFYIGEDLNIYNIFSIYKIEAEDYYIQTDFNDDAYKTFLDTIKKRSIKNFGIDLNTNSKILTLSTCSSGNKYRLVVHASLEY